MPLSQETNQAYSTTPKTNMGLTKSGWSGLFWRVCHFDWTVQSALKAINHQLKPGLHQAETT